MRNALVLMTCLLLVSPALAGEHGDPDANCDGSTYEMVECLKAQELESKSEKH